MKKSEMKKTEKDDFSDGKNIIGYKQKSQKLALFYCEEFLF